MALIDRMPKYAHIEPNNLKGLQAGLVVAQMPVAESAKEALTSDGMMENGTICDISVEGIIAPTTTSKNLFICYNEPLNTVYGGDEFYAVDLAEEHARLVQLMPGDEWMTSKKLTLTGDSNPLAGRIVEVTTSTGLGKSDDWFSSSVMANGDTGYHYVFIG